MDLVSATANYNLEHFDAAERAGRIGLAVDHDRAYPALHRILGETLHALDLATGHSAPVALLPGKIENIAIGPRGDLYVTCGADLYRINP